MLPLPSFRTRAAYFRLIRREALSVLRAYPFPAEGHADPHASARDDDIVERLHGMPCSGISAPTILGFSDHPLVAEEMLGEEEAHACTIEHRARLAMLADIRETVLAFRDIPDVLAAVLRITKEAPLVNPTQHTPGTPTRFHELNLIHLDKRAWQYVATDTGSQVGPCYATKAEALADLERFAAQYGCHGADTVRTAAPELLEALEAFANAYTEDGEFNAHTAEYGTEELVAMARAAIAKAKAKEAHS